MFEIQQCVSANRLGSYHIFCLIVTLFAANLKRYVKIYEYLIERFKTSLCLTYAVKSI